MTRDKAGPDWLDNTMAVAVGLVAFGASYRHMEHVALVGGEPLEIARAFPITVDGLAVVAYRRGEQGRWWLRVALVISVACNVVARFPEIAAAAGPLVSAWYPVAAYGIHRMCRNVKPAPEPKKTPKPPTEAPKPTEIPAAPRKLNGTDPLAARLEQIVQQRGAVPSQRWVAENLKVGRERAERLRQPYLKADA